MQDQWQIIQVTNCDALSPRNFPAVSILNANEIIIMGGREQIGFLGDIISFNPHTNTAEKIFQGDSDYLELQAYG